MTIQPFTVYFPLPEIGFIFYYLILTYRCVCVCLCESKFLCMCGCQKLMLRSRFSLSPMPVPVIKLKLSNLVTSTPTFWANSHALEIASIISFQGRPIGLIQCILGLFGIASLWFLWNKYLNLSFNHYPYDTKTFLTILWSNV